MHLIGPTTGDLEIRTTTVGVDFNSLGYDVQILYPGIGEFRHVRVPTNGTITLPGVPPGVYSLMFFDVIPNCDPVLPSPRTVTVVAGDTGTINLDVICAAPTQLAFVSGSGIDAEIYVVNSNGTGTSRITTQVGADVNPAWSPDGGRIAFASERDGNFEIYAMNADGTNPVRLTNASAADYRPAWSPDGARIAFVSEREGNAEIYVMNADGSNPVRLTNQDAKDGDPAWSPDGSRIAFFSGRDGPPEIYVMAADGTNPSRLTTNGVPDSHPVWSPDGTTIAFSRGDNLGNNQIYVMNADGSRISRLSQFVLNGSDPSWSPNGRKIAFTALYCDYFYYDECYSILQVVRTDGAPYQLTTGQYASEPAWRP
jgi:Tol biopolymer transport system component